MNPVQPCLRVGLLRRYAQPLLWALGLTLACGVTIAITVWPRVFNHQEVFTRHTVLFVEADCYARMIRAADVYTHPGKIIRHHDFENWPQGTSPHTTAPLDYVIAGIAWSLAGRVSLDAAGAVTGPLLAALTSVVLLLFWLFGSWPSGWATLIVFAFSPALVWATILGRPDHQALLVFLVTVAALMEFRMMLGTQAGEADTLSHTRLATRARLAPWVAGTAWGLALWTSLFEPLILFVAFTAAGLVAGGGLAVKERKGGWALMGGILLCALLLEGVRVTLPGADPLFANWARLIPELRNASFGESLRWGGWVLFGTPIVILVQAIPGWSGSARSPAPLFGVAGLLLLFIGLALWQKRWSPYAILLCAIALPWGLRCLGTNLAGQIGRMALVVASLWPVGAEWEALLYPTPARVAVLEERRNEALALHTLSSRLVASPRESGKNMGVLAPYWFGPALAYWSGRPSVGGTSHQSLCGIADTAAFYLAERGDQAMEILRRRKVGFVIGYDAQRIMATSQVVLERRGTALSLGNVLVTKPWLAPPELKLSARIGPFALYDVQELQCSRP